LEKNLNKLVILEVFNHWKWKNEKMKNGETKFYWFSKYSQVYWRIIVDLYFLFFNSHIKLNLLHH
jgi:hypothetical protein